MIGRIEELAPDIQEELEVAIARTAATRGMLFNIALNYGGRAEIVDAARRAIEAGRAARGSRRGPFASFLYTAGQPDPDLMIRTSGEMRVSNYLLWQIAYAEIYVTDTLWPDFRRRHLLDAVLAYQKRERRYGGIPTPAAAIGVHDRARGSARRRGRPHDASRQRHRARAGGDRRDRLAAAPSRCGCWPPPWPEPPRSNTRAPPRSRAIRAARWSS